MEELKKEPDSSVTETEPEIKADSQETVPVSAETGEPATVRASAEDMPAGGRKKGKYAKEKDKGEWLLVIGNFFFAFFLTVFGLLAVIMIGLRIMGFTMLNVETGSMHPEIPVNTLIFVQNTDPKEIQKGDVITFVMNEQGTMATHRVVRVNSSSQTFTTKGDANNTEDPPVSFKNVVGKVKFRFPKVGYIFQMITSPDNRPVMIGIIIGMIVVVFVWEYIVKLFKRKKPKRARDEEP